MEVSTFELLYKPLVPRSLVPGGDAIARRVFQGYFLTITNLEAQRYIYRLDFYVTTPDALDPPRARIITDVGAGNSFNVPLGTSNPNRYFREFSIAARSTALFVLLPDLSVDGFFETTPANYEVRGYVEISLPCIFTTNGLRPQSDRPVRVLLNPELRATYLPNNFPAVNGGDFDQTITALTVASGQGLNELPPWSCFFPFNDEIRAAVRARLTQFPLGIDPVERASQMVTGLAEMAGSEEGASALNSLLDEFGMPMRVEYKGGQA